VINLIGWIWKIITPGMRLKIIRATQKKFTVSVGVIVTDREGKVLLLEHIFRPASGWGIPGGFVEHGEQPEAAIRREIREETGIELENVRMLRVRTTQRHVEILFRAEATDPGRVKSREIKSLGWFAADAMPDGMSPIQKSLIEKVLGGEFDNFIGAD
jgi:8-oxo-dGTP diphosphatase